VAMGKIYLDDGAVKALCNQGKSLLAAGITKIEGEFNASEAVELIDFQGQEIAKGIVNYSYDELTKIKGKKSADIPHILGYYGAETVIHRDNLVVFD
jgi:glutamate 5-kinase